MGFLKDAGETLLKYSEKVVNKTEEYAKIAKLTMDIKKMENGIEKAHTEIGDFVMKLVEKGEASLSLHDTFLTDRTRTIKEYKEIIEAKRKEIEEVKKSSQGRV